MSKLSMWLTRRSFFEWATGLLLLASLVGVESAHAQAETRWLNIGQMQHKLSATGAEPEVMRQSGLVYPGLLPDATHFNRKSLWIGVKSHTTEDGETFAPRVAHTGPRVFNLDEFYPKPIRLISRFEPPEVLVDGFQSFQEPVQVDEVDPSMKADRMVVREANTVLGVTMHNEVRAFSNPYHDNYMVYEYTFTNTGNADDDSDIEYPEQTLEGVMFYTETKYQYQMHRGNISAPGTNTMNDIVGDGMEDYNVDFRAIYAWAGNVPWPVANALGSPVWNDNGGRIAPGDSSGRLAAPEFVTRATIHADKSAVNEEDDPSQPAMMGTIRGGDPITNNNDAWTQSQMRDEYNFIHPDFAYRDYGEGTQYPHHADLVAPPRENFGSWAEQMANQTAIPNRGHGGGWISTVSWGPYTLEPGQSVRIVYVEGFAGISYFDAAVKIGEAYKQSGGNNDLEIPFDANSNGTIENDVNTDGDGEIEYDEKMTKNMWVMSGRDSLWQMLGRARANFQSGYGIPHEPKPPKRFEVTSGTDRIILEWTPYEGAVPVNGWEIYRTRNRYQGSFEGDWTYEKIATLSPEARSYEDEDVTRGISYFYYIQAVGAVNQNATGQTPTGAPLKSNRYYTQTYTPAYLRRSPGEELSSARVVPNPYHLGSSQNVRWPDQQDKIGFLDIPGDATIKIYTETGELIETIEHTNGSGDEYWNLTTSSNQVVVSGVYVAVIEDNTSGEQVLRRFVVIR